MGAPGRVPWGSMDRYAVRFGVQGDAYFAFLEIIEELDRAYLDWVSKEIERQREESGSGGNPGSV